MVIALIVIVFIVGYIAIAFEHPLRLNKAASALIMWYLKKISWLAIIGFTAGILVFLLQMKM